jgi:hypothetical protein
MTVIVGYRGRDERRKHPEKKKERRKKREKRKHQKRSEHTYIEAEQLQTTRGRTALVR